MVAMMLESHLDRPSLMHERLIDFTIVAFGIMLVPGPDFAVVTRNAVRNRAQGLATAFGVAAGLTLHTGLAVLGLAAILATSPRLFTALTIVGGGYIVYLGARALAAFLHAAFRHRAKDASEVSPAVSGGVSRSAVQGFLTNATNPKAPLLFLSLLPQFVPRGAPVVPWTLLLSVIAVAAGLIWFVTVVVIIGRIAKAMNHPATMRIIDLATGIALVALGGGMVIERL
jgi:threonine/homoserine/homoserine lactone efflux protein